jgi:hypothetical protein
MTCGGLTIQWCSRAAVPNPALRASEVAGATASRRLLHAPSESSFSRSNRRAASPARQGGRAQHTGTTLARRNDRIDRRTPLFGNLECQLASVIHRLPDGSLVPFGRANDAEVRPSCVGMPRRGVMDEQDRVAKSPGYSNSFIT